MDNWVERIRAREIRAIARAATAIENDRPEGLALLDSLTPGPGIAVGITGPPGAGKSSLVEALIAEIRRRGKTVAILAVDPSSPFTGGAILGDRIRMQKHHNDPGVFIRSMATRGASGGLAKASANLTRLLRAAGFDYVLIETVGVGQDEIDIARLADVTVVVLVPGLGDDIQAIKAGLMEVAGIFVINKADHPGVDRTEAEIRAALSLTGSAQPEVLRTVAIQGEGVAQLLDAIVAAGFVKPAAIPARPAIDHIAIAVRSIDQALLFYRDMLGLPEPARETVEHEQVHVAMLATTGGRIELLEPTEPESAVARFLDKRGEGLHHVAIRVADFDATLASLRARGARLLNEPKRGAGGHRYVFVHPGSAGGVLLEIIAE